MDDQQLIETLRATSAKDTPHLGAIHVIANSGVLHKIRPYLKTYSDGTGIDWRRLANEIDDQPWSSTERAMARIALHLAGSAPDDTVPDTDLRAWLLGPMLNRLDNRQAQVVIDAIRIAVGW